jgi:hypothetical protein
MVELYQSILLSLLFYGFKPSYEQLIENYHSRRKTPDMRGFTKANMLVMLYVLFNL